ncbi:class I SAM-dependent methyltransferase [Mycobacterium sp. pUA109]|uniref:class I SAM-dependent methyltransferase n=1 Tax=Mycobacterium sp. pUA109 TaxID=3238982 RepID=UPI00351B07F8
MTVDTSTIAEQTAASLHRTMWAMGDYALMAEQVMAPIGPTLVSASGIGAGDRVLDVAAGSGNISIPAALTGATVVSSDLTPELLQRSRLRAVEHKVTMDWQEADAQALPFGDDEFDAVLSGIGVMFAPNHQRAADELVRVCRPGGTIALANWTPDGFFGRMLAAIRPYRPTQVPGVPPAALWGRDDYVRNLLGGRVDIIRSRRWMLQVDRFDSAAAVHDYFKNHYGPTIDAYRLIGDNPAVAAALDAELVELADQHLRDGVMQWEYLLVTAQKR